MQSANPSNHPIAPTVAMGETVDKAESERERVAFKAVSKLKNKVSEMTGANHNRNGAKNCAQKKNIVWCLRQQPAVRNCGAILRYSELSGTTSS